MSPDLQDAVEETTVDNATAMDTPRDESAASNTASDVHGAEPNDLEDDLAAGVPHNKVDPGPARRVGRW